MKMTEEQLAARLNGRQYGDEITSAEEQLAKENGLVVIFGASDDLCEMRGAIDDEFDPTISGGYKRDISELDHLVFDSKREEKEEKTAHWDINTEGYYPFCSHCGEATQHMSAYCGNCGAKMVTRRHEE